MRPGRKNMQIWRRTDAGSAGALPGALRHCHPERSRMIRLRINRRSRRTSTDRNDDRFGVLGCRKLGDAGRIFRYRGPSTASCFAKRSSYSAQDDSSYRLYWFLFFSSWRSCPSRISRSIKFRIVQSRSRPQLGIHADRGKSWHGVDLVQIHLPVLGVHQEIYPRQAGTVDGLEGADGQLLDRFWSPLCSAWPE